MNASFGLFAWGISFGLCVAAIINNDYNFAATWAAYIFVGLSLLGWLLLYYLYNAIDDPFDKDAYE